MDTDYATMNLRRLPGQLKRDFEAKCIQKGHTMKEVIQQLMRLVLEDKVELVIDNCTDTYTNEDLSSIVPESSEPLPEPASEPEVIQEPLEAPESILESGESHGE